jgi:hypothetical protein
VSDELWKWVDGRKSKTGLCIQFLEEMRPKFLYRLFVCVRDDGVDASGEVYVVARDAEGAIARWRKRSNPQGEEDTWVVSVNRVEIEGVQFTVL